ncbi:hypothetical protein Aduo_016842 [Ancylostoma duodenale]
MHKVPRGSDPATDRIFEIAPTATDDQPPSSTIGAWIKGYQLVGGVFDPTKLTVGLLICPCKRRLSITAPVACSYLFLILLLRVIS